MLDTPMPENRDAILCTVEGLIANAVKLLLPECGEQTTVGILEQMAAEQARYQAMRRDAGQPELPLTRH